VGNYYGQDPENRLIQNGQISILLGKNGAFTGALLLEGKRIGTKGIFDSQGNAEVSLTSPSGSRVLINLLLENYIGTGLRVAGTITLSDAQALDFTCYLTAYDGTSSGTFPLQGRTINTAWLCESGSFGHGFASAKAAKDGALRFAGRLADGSTWTGTARAVRDEIQALRALVAMPLSSAKGLLHGELIINEANPLALQSELPLTWIRSANPKSKTYANGIEELLNVQGSVWAIPNNGSILSAENLTLSLDIDQSILGQSGGAISATWTSANKAIFKNAPKGLTFKVTKSSGLFTGKAIPVNGATGKAVTYSGLLFNPPLEDASTAGTPLHGAGFLTISDVSAPVEMAE
jgi:hypothetical protein